MAKPRVFVSSTFYDLKHVRASLDLFIQSLGYETTLSEKGDIAYSFDRPLDESCYAEVGSADIFVLIVGGRYGAAASDQQVADETTFYDRYVSITRKEYERAVELDIPVYIVVERAVLTELETFRANRENADVRYVHADSVNIFLMLEYILNQPRNNATYGFEKFTEVESWLRDQWAGLFRDLLKRTSQAAQLTTLSAQVSEMSSLNQTLKNYMEKLVSSVTGAQESEALFTTEDNRRAHVRRMRSISEKHGVIPFLMRRSGLPVEAVMEHLERSTTARQFLTLLSEHGDPEVTASQDLFEFLSHRAFVEDLNAVRADLNLAAFRRPPVRRVAKTDGPRESGEHA